MSEKLGYFQIKGKATKTGKSVKRRDVVMPCPVTGCGEREIWWKCFDCRALLEYGISDGRLNCDCGTSALANYRFMCGSHGLRQANATKLKAALEDMPTYEELNLVLLGETGVGKSTFINALANYLSYSTLEEARKNELITLVPNQFYLMDDNFEEVCIINGPESNEECQETATQATKVHRFIFGETVIKIIDTPGFGDVRGALKDEENCENILDTVASLDVIHGIIILLKPNQAKLTVSFKYCIEKLLAHLHRSAVHNIIFGYTQTRATNFRPGETNETLKKLLSQKAVNLKNEKENTFCFESEGYRFLATLKYGIEYDKDALQAYASSWKYSVKETERLIGYIKSLTAHETKLCLSLNNARTLFLQLTKPMAEITRAIIMNVEKNRKIKEQIKNLEESIFELSEGLMMDRIDLEARELEQPRTVCTNSECIEVMEFDGIKSVNYLQWCHEPCYCSGGQVETTNNRALIKCPAIGGTHNCRICGHNYAEHMHMTYELVEKVVRIENKGVKKLITENILECELKAAKIAELEWQTQEYEDEHREIEKIAAKLSAYLKHNSITIYSDAMLDHLQFLISEEEKKPPEDRDIKLLEALLEVKRSYEGEVDFLERVIESGKLKINDPAIVERLFDDFFKLKHPIQHLTKLDNEETHQKELSDIVGHVDKGLVSGASLPQNNSGAEQKQQTSHEGRGANSSSGGHERTETRKCTPKPLMDEAVETFSNEELTQMILESNQMQIETHGSKPVSYDTQCCACGEFGHRGAHCMSSQRRTTHEKNESLAHNPAHHLEREGLSCEESAKSESMRASTGNLCERPGPSSSAEPVNRSVSMENQNRYCDNCGQQGHIANKCRLVSVNQIGLNVFEPVEHQKQTQIHQRTNVQNSVEPLDSTSECSYRKSPEKRSLEPERKLSSSPIEHSSREDTPIRRVEKPVRRHESKFVLFLTVTMFLLWTAWTIGNFSWE